MPDNGTISDNGTPTVHGSEPEDYLPDVFFGHAKAFVAAHLAKESKQVPPPPPSPQVPSAEQCSNLTPIFIGMYRNAPLSLMKRVPGCTIPMVPMHLAPMAPMDLVKQIRALIHRYT